MSEHGVVYTKRWVVDLILDLVGYTSDSGITGKIIIEPSCGCGAFIAPIAERLASEAKKRSIDWMELAGAVRGYDTDPFSISTAKSSVINVLTALECPEKEASFLAEEWLSCQDFILGEVPECDFVVGNPPYVRATEIDPNKRGQYCELLPSVTSGCDLYVSFYDKGLNALRDGGSLCFICADRWLQNAYGKRLRRRVTSFCDLETLVRMHGVDAFESEVDAYPAITLIRKRPPKGQIKFIDCKSTFNANDVNSLKEWLSQHGSSLFTGNFEAFGINRPRNDEVYPLGNAETVEFVSRAREKLPSLEESGAKIGIGIATGRDKVFLTYVENLVEPERMMPIFNMRDYRRGRGTRRQWLVNPWSEDGKLVSLDDYPKLKAYFEENSDTLRARHIARKNGEEWYRTIDKPIPGLEKRELLLMPDMATTSDPVLSQGFYPAHNTYWISSEKWDMRVLGGFLMADTTKRFVDALGVKMRGGTLRFQAQYLRLVHLPAPSQISTEVKESLAKAFCESDRNAATKYADIAYKEAME